MQTKLVADHCPVVGSPGRRVIVLRSLAGASALILTLLSACKPAAPAKPSFFSIDITGANFATQLDLTDHNGQRRSLADFKGKFVVVFFGFLQCPDICPTTLAEWNAVREKLAPEQQQRLQLLFVTVDPSRDSPEQLKAYVTGFHPTNLGLTGTDAEIAAAARNFKVVYEKVAGKTPGSYTIDHTAASFVFDAEGKVRLYVRMGQSVDKTVADMKTLMG